MFYSHTFLARKGPLGTVWCAAHLQHKLRKSHYISTNVPSTAGFWNANETLDGRKVQSADCFRYLRSIIQADGGLDGDVAHRIKSGWLKWKSATGFLCDPGIPNRLKGKFYRTAIRPALLYGTECWAVKQCHVHKMPVAEMRMLRWMCGHTRKDRVRNEIIRTKVGVTCIENKMRENRLRWFGHIKRREMSAPVRRLERWQEEETMKERIMFPQVPIALRMSAHLLLGVVRIYSKQVDYLYEDCNEIRITINRVFTTVSVNLPHDATHAPPHSVTLPEKLGLDTLDLDDYYKDLGEDSHFKSHADLTLTEQIPTGKDPYIIIHFDEQDMRASSHTEDDSGSRIRPTPMDEDAPPSFELHTPAELKDPSSSNHLGAVDRNVGDTTLKESHEIEIMRDAVHGFDFNNSPILPDRAAPDKILEEQINKDNGTFTHAMEDIPLPDGHFSTSHTYHEEQHSFGLLSSPTPLLGGPSPKIELGQSPPVAQPKVRRKRKQYFDEVTVLSNRCMKDALNDTSNIRRVKRECPSSALDIWKQDKRLRLRKEDVIFEPFITGTCAEIQALYKEDFILAKFQLANTDETHKETNVAQTPTHNSNIEIEIRRDNKCPSPDRHIPFSSTPVPSPAGRSCFTPENSNLGLRSELMETTGRDGPLPTEDMGPSGNLDSEMQTPDTFYEKGSRAEHTVLSDVPELVSSAAGELGFLEEDDYSPAGTQATPGIGLFSNSQEPPELQALPSRTRAVAQYLKRQSSVTPILGNFEESPEDLSLNKILDGKPTKVCARMFFETLVLKTHGLVDVHQENPYDNITLKVTPKLSKGQFSV
ncbi:hypothetical protein OROGR_020964 [Orobanche gracilis]